MHLTFREKETGGLSFPVYLRSKGSDLTKTKNVNDRDVLDDNVDGNGTSNS